MAARLIALPGGGPTTPAEPPRKPVTSAPCPVCTYPIRSDEFDDILQCTRCNTAAHGPCFWRMLPLSEWLDYWAWLNETDELDREYVCAACRQLEGLGK